MWRVDFLLGEMLFEARGGRGGRRVAWFARGRHYQGGYRGELKEARFAHTYSDLLKSLIKCYNKSDEI